LSRFVEYVSEEDVGFCFVEKADEFGADAYGALCGRMIRAGWSCIVFYSIVEDL